MNVSIVRKLLCLSGATFLLACEPHGRNTTKMQYMPDMADAPTVKPQSGYLEAPDHAVAASAILYPESMAKAEAGFKNPYAALQSLENVPPGSRQQVMQTSVAESGELLFNTFCAVCHGKDGKGVGTMGESYPLQPPNLTRDDLHTRPDGYFFMVISKGKALMPGYAHAIEPDERWKMVNHIRNLQKK